MAAIAASARSSSSEMRQHSKNICEAAA